MMRVWRMSSLALVATVAVAACDDVPTEPEAPPAVQRAEAPRTIGLDAHFEQIARDVPGFGGAYVDDSGRTVVHMARRDLAVEAQRIRSELGGRLGLRTTLRSGDMPVMRSAAGPSVVLEEADFDYTELVDFKGRAGSVFALPGAVYTDIDETSNRIRIGIEAGAGEAPFRRALEAAGVPAEAVTFATAEPIRALKGMTLRDRVQPLGGGLQLVFPNPRPGFVSLCTLGFNVDLPGRGRSDNHFVTNSHCTLDQGAADGTPYYQQPVAFLDPSYQIGVEVSDPPFFNCFGTFVCRFSDAALVRYVDRRTPVKHDAIYRPESVNTGSLNIASKGPGYFKIVGEAAFPQVGDVLSKVGRTTGWTEGEVFLTCANVGVTGTNIGLLCQDLVFADVAGGDSGSPVFMRHGNSGDVTLYGILWGGGPGLFVFSAMENIRTELPAFSLY